MFVNRALFGIRSFRKTESLPSLFCCKNRRPLSKWITSQAGKMRIVTVPILEDNYAYLLIDDNSGDAAVVDPAQVPPVVEAVKREKIRVTTLLTTHHHWDHAGGNKEMLAALKDLQPEDDIHVVSGDERIHGTQKISKQDDIISIGSMRIRVLEAPCHTTGHLLYHVTDVAKPDQQGVVFTGDTLFVGGCGRFFEGTPEQMHKALNVTIRSLPGNTLTFVGHEYTLSNFKFAKTIEPNNQALLDKIAWAEARRKDNLPTVPTSIEDELLYNPFMRVSQDSVREGLVQSYGVPKEELASDVGVMKWLRLTKNDGKAAVEKYASL